jgi:hypothetical protein
MAIFRSDTEKTLDELISNEEGMRFQGLAVTLAQQRWPDLIACERKKDLGADAVATESLAAEGSGKVLACSITATLRKLREDATGVREHFSGIKILIFATPHGVTNQSAQHWATEIRKEFGYELVVIPREEIIAALLAPANTSLSRNFLQPLSSGSLSVDVSVMAPDLVLQQPTDPLQLRYVTEKHDDFIEVLPELGYYSAISRGDSIFGTYYWTCPFKWEFPNLDPKVVNNSRQTILFSDAILDVESSSPKSVPVLVIKADRLGRNARHFMICNEGWAETESCHVKYGSMPWKESWSKITGAVASDCDFSQCPHDLLVGKFVSRANPDVMSALESDGVDFDRLDALIKQKSEEGVSDEEWEREIEKAIGVFKEGAALIYGTIAYSWRRESTGSEIYDNLQFFTKVYLTNARRYGLPKPPSFEYQAECPLPGTALPHPEPWHYALFWCTWVQF